ncbi:MAG: Uma2 family endonuclease, partial [Candidatus Binatia bacterium]
MPSVARDICQRHRLTVADYYRMGEVGIFPPEARVELIEGEVIDMPPIGSVHAGTVGFVAKRLERAAGDHVLVFVQNPVLLSVHNEPQPDIVVLRPRADFYRISHPTPADVLLIVEVADTT